MHEEKKGAAPKLPVEDDDLPEGLGDEEGEESCDCSEEECDDPDDPACATHGKKSKGTKGR